MNYDDKYTSPTQQAMKNVGNNRLLEQIDAINQQLNGLAEINDKLIEYTGNLNTDKQLQIAMEEIEKARIALRMQLRRLG